MKVKGFLYDIKGTDRILKLREEKIEEADEVLEKNDPIKELANELHPEKIIFKIVQVDNCNGNSKKIKFKISKNSPIRFIPVFQAGQYISFKFNIGKSFATRPFSISSAPYEARNNGKKDGFLEVTIKQKKDGFITKYIWDNWKVGVEVEAAGPLGHFYYEPLRDSKNIVAIAGGSGITPFHSMAREIVYGKLDASMTLIYGSRCEKDILFKEEFEKLEKESKGRLKVINVLSDEDGSWKGEKGFITSEIIKKYCDIKKSSFFICGPQIMYKFVGRELDKLNLKSKQIRREVFGQAADIYAFNDFKEEAKGKTFNIKVHIGEKCVNVKGYSGESVLVALEKEGIKHDSHCRSGECGFCRSKLIKGDVYVVPENDGRREADKIYGYFHPCSSYPLSDIEIRIPIV